jgi:hypothetical protein
MLAMMALTKDLSMVLPITRRHLMTTTRRQMVTTNTTRTHTTMEDNNRRPRLSTSTSLNRHRVTNSRLTCTTTLVEASRVSTQTPTMARDSLAKCLKPRLDPQCLRWHRWGSTWLAIHQMCLPRARTRYLEIPIRCFPVDDIRRKSSDAQKLDV